MADLTVNVAIAGNKIPPWSSTVSRNITNALFSISSTLYTQGFDLAPITTGTAIPLGQVVACGWAFILNTDGTNFVKLSNGLSGAVFIKLKPGEFFLGPLLDACVPFWVADTATCLCEYLIFSR